MSSLSEQMEANAVEAMKLTRKHFVVELDFSESSMEQLEGLANDVDFIMPGGKSEENIELLTRVWGSYVGEVIRRNLDGQWVESTEGDDTPASIEVGGSVVNPFGQIRKRLQGESASNLWTFYQDVRDSS
ncbi:MAG: hypothetical protein IH991_25640 [Planctomycetes bacterium]|nr:hypothetical protein [Planctomycetota bacterium]